MKNNNPSGLPSGGRLQMSFKTMFVGNVSSVAPIAAIFHPAFFRPTACV